MDEDSLSECTSDSMSSANFGKNRARHGVVYRGVRRFTNCLLNFYPILILRAIFSQCFSFCSWQVCGGRKRKDEKRSRFYRSHRMPAAVTRYIAEQIDALRKIEEETKDAKLEENAEEGGTFTEAESEPKPPVRKASVEDFQSLKESGEQLPTKLVQGRGRWPKLTMIFAPRNQQKSTGEPPPIPPLSPLNAPLSPLTAFSESAPAPKTPKTPAEWRSGKSRRRSVFDEEIRQPQLASMNMELNRMEAFDARFPLPSSSPPLQPELQSPPLPPSSARDAEQGFSDSKSRRRSVFDEIIRQPQLEYMNRELAASDGYDLQASAGRLAELKTAPKTMSSGRANTEIYQLTGRTEKCSIPTVSQLVLENGNELSYKDEEKRAVRTVYNNNSNADLKYGDRLTTKGSEFVDETPLDGFAIVINGSSLVHALNERYEKLFLEIACLCVSVICCRVTPLQKAKVVDLVKRHVKTVTLAIGDGANDVSMIKTAHIGVGISGQEGMQAVLASDFSIGQFRYLERLLLVHGRWSYLRMSKFLRYFFYKNFSYTLTHFWYSFFCGYSAQTIYDPLLMACFNMFFTSLPVLAMGVFDQDVNDEYSLRYPKLYIPGQYNQYFNMRIFVYSVIHGGVSSIIIFFIPYGTINNSVDSNGKDVGDYTMLSFTVFTALVIVVTVQIMLDTSYWTIYNHLCLWGSLLLYAAVVTFFYQILPNLPRRFSTSAVIASYDVVWRAVRLPHFWLALLLICVILLVPILANRFFWLDTRPSYADRLRLLYRLYGNKRLPPRDDGFSTPYSKQGPVRTAATRRSRRGSLRSGYAFSHSQGFGELIAKGTLFRNLEHLRIPSFKHSDSPKNTKSLSPKKKGKAPLSSLAEQTSPAVDSDCASTPKSSSLLSSLKNSFKHSKAGAFPLKKKEAFCDSAQINNNSPASSESTQQQGHVTPRQQQQQLYLPEVEKQNKGGIYLLNEHELQTRLGAFDSSEPHDAIKNVQMTPRIAKQHKLLVNVNEEEPLPSNWTQILNLERPPHSEVRSIPSNTSTDVSEDYSRYDNDSSIAEGSNRSRRDSFVSKQRRNSLTQSQSDDEAATAVGSERHLQNTPSPTSSTQRRGRESRASGYKSRSAAQKKTYAPNLRRIDENNQANLPKISNEIGQNAGREKSAPAAQSRRARPPSYTSYMTQKKQAIPKSKQPMAERHEHSPEVPSGFNGGQLPPTKNNSRSPASSFKRRRSSTSSSEVALANLPYHASLTSHNVMGHARTLGANRAHLARNTVAPTVITISNESEELPYAGSSMSFFKPQKISPTEAHVTSESSEQPRSRFSTQNRKRQKN